MGRAVWVDASAGVAGDMLAAALVDAGVPLEVMTDAVRAVLPDVTLTTTRVSRNGLAATKFDVVAGADQPHRHLADIHALLDAAPISDEVRTAVKQVFARLADVEAAAHGTSVDDVHFHEVGAVDSIADIVAVCAGLHHFECDDLHFGLVELGTGTVRAAHGELPVPTPAALRLSQGLQVQAGAALLTTLSRDYVRTLMAAGIGRRSVLFKHALRNAAAPVLTVLGFQFIGLLGGSIIVEQVFALRGLGLLVQNAIYTKDVPIVQGVVIFAAVMVVVVNLAIDLFYAWLNPKVRTA